MVCYDIREKHRLQRIQRLTAKRTVYSQHGNKLSFFYKDGGQQKHVTHPT